MAEVAKSRSESPFQKSKTKGQLTDIPENGEANSEHLKTKKKSQRNKKAQLNGKENEDSERNGNEFYEEEALNSCQAENNDYKNNSNGTGEVDKTEENDAFVNACSDAEEKPTNSDDVMNNEVHDKMHEGNNKDSTDNDEPTTTTPTSNDVDPEESFKENCNSTMMNETESSAKNGIPQNETSVLSESEMNKSQSLEEMNGTDINNVSDAAAENHEPTDASMEEVSQNGVNGSDDSYYEELDVAKDQIQASPDTGAKEDGYFSHKISNFLGKWNLSSAQEQKEDSEISSSKKTNDLPVSEEAGIKHPYLSRVTGRPGIREKMNSSMSSFVSQDEEMKTPKNAGSTLNDSFRVRTNPPRLNPSEIQESTNLRKYKGKRCLNANDDEPEDGEDAYLALSKRQKLDDKTQESGFLGTILWSPFKKKSLESDEPLKVTTTTESKLSRFLSPFWFWKKTAEGQKEK